MRNLSHKHLAATITEVRAKKIPLPPLYDEAALKASFDTFMESVDMLAVSKGYPKTVKKLLSGDPAKQVQAVKTLAETGEVEAIPWLLLFLDSDICQLVRKLSVMFR